MATQHVDLLGTTLVHHPNHARRMLFSLSKPCIPSHGCASVSVRPRSHFLRKNRKIVIPAYATDKPKAVTGQTLDSISVKATVTVKLTTGGFFLSRGLHEIADLLGKPLLLELVSAEVDPKTGLEKEPISQYARRIGQKDGVLIYQSEFVVAGDFGEIGAVMVQNEHQNEIYFKCITLNGLPNGSLLFNCDSWVQPKSDKPEKRIFFTNKSYLPSQTPRSLWRLREKDLESLRGNGKIKYKSPKRIYDYDVYNNLGDASEFELARPVLGGTKKYPYPRRCKTDACSERRGIFCVPRDEEFSEETEKYLITNTADAVLQAFPLSLEACLIEPDLDFPVFTEIDKLYNQGIPSPKLRNQRLFQNSVVRLMKAFSDSTDDVLKVKTTNGMLQKGKFSWFRDEEFARQTLAGVNPCSIKLVTEWPLKSPLDPDVYGPPESAITTELVEKDIKDFMTVEEALEQRKLFIIDYHDMLLPFVSKVRQIEGTTLYGSRTLFFLTPDGTLKPLAIELTRPPLEGKPQWKQVFTPSLDATGLWLWRFAKAHFLAHDSGYHELVSHWLRTHCATEPYIIATKRQLSVMHPIYRLLQPHCRRTIKINALARQVLINASGIIERSFSLGKYSMELSSMAYDQHWRFDREALPADLINRGIAIEDPSAPHGLKLLIEDYPFANDGLMLWDALKIWVADYVNYYYKDDSMVQSDPELQAWWTEVRTKGHEDKKDEPWWPLLQTPQDLIEIITTIVWVASGHHSAVNFGQYVYGGCYPIRPTIARTNMPCEDPTSEGWKQFSANPNAELLACFPSAIQATEVMAILGVLSSHSPHEQFLGEHMEPSWDEEPYIKEAFGRFSERLKELEKVIDARNADVSLKNRGGDGVVPYEFLKPFSEAGLTGKGVPYSITI